MPHRLGSVFPGRVAGPGWVVAGYSAAYLALAVLAGIRFQLPVRDSLAFLAVVTLAFYVPGSLILSAACVRLHHPLGRTLLSFAVGSVLSPLAYQLSRVFGSGGIALWAPVLFLSAIWLFLYGRRRKHVAAIRVDEAVALGGILLVVLLLLSFSHFVDVRFTSDGLLLNTSHLTESVYHLGIVNALADAYPPPSLYASGTGDLSYYHLGMHLQIEMIARLSGIDTLRLASFYFPFLYFSLLASLPFLFVRLVGGTVPLAAVAGLLVFGADFSYVPGLLLGGESPPWTLYFATTIWSLFTLNGYIPAVIALFTCLIFLWRFLKDGHPGELAVMAACTVGAFGFKSSLGLQLAAAVAATAMVLFFADRAGRRSRDLLLAGVLLSAGLLAWSWRIGVGTEAVEVRLMPLAQFGATLERLGLVGVDVVWYPVLIGLFILGGLGVRALGLWALPGRVRERTALGGLTLFVWLFFLGGYLLSELLFLGRPGGQNNAVWFYVQSLMAAWFALFAYLARAEAAGRRAAWLSLGLLLLAVPSTLQFLHQRAMPEYRQFTAHELSVADFLRTTSPESVVLHPLNLDEPSLASNFAGRPSVLNAFRSFVVEEDGLFERAADVEQFFGPDASLPLRLQILRKYGVDYVYGPDDLLRPLLQVPGVTVELRAGALGVYRFTDTPAEAKVSDASHSP